MEQITLAGVFLAGLLSFLSPCVLPMLPTFSVILAGAGEKPAETFQQSGSGADGLLDAGRLSFSGNIPLSLRLYGNVTAFLTGFTVMFVLMGATASFLGQYLFEYQSFVRKAGAVLIVLMGLFMAGLFTPSLLDREYRPFLRQKVQGPWGSLLLGMAFTVGWTPCTGPILATILLYAGETETVAQGALLLFVYAAGFAVPFFLLTAVWKRYLAHLRGFYTWLPKIQKAAGVVLILLGICIWFNWLPRLLGLLWS